MAMSVSLPEATCQWQWIIHEYLRIDDDEWTWLPNDPPFIGDIVKSESIPNPIQFVLRSPKKSQMDLGNLKVQDMLV